MKRRILAFILCMLMCTGMVTMFSACGGDDSGSGSGNNGGGSTKPNAFVIMSEALDGVFNPFYSTSAPDGTIVSMTQIGMITNNYVNGEIEVAFGDDEAVVVKDYESSYDSYEDKTTYTFVIKNGIKFSDGKPLTMHDVMFNLYVYLDPNYTGSSTMYSTDIEGLKSYRLQQFVSDDDASSDTAIINTANGMATDRLNELINLFRQVGDPNGTGSYNADSEAMINAIKTYSVSSGYIKAIFTDKEKNAFASEAALQEAARAQLLADYERTLKLFKEELERDYNSALEAYTEEPYKSTGMFNDVVSFMCLEGFVEIKYAEGADGKIDRTKIEKVTLQYNTDVAKDKASAINYVYESKVSSELDVILSFWATATTLRTEYTAKGKEIALKNQQVGDSLLIPNISGIVSLGHREGSEEDELIGKGDVITVNGTEYKVATEHNNDGTVKNEGEYDVLQITINGVDPKAIWNFAFAVAPQHYYAPGYEVDIENNKFGVEFGSTDFMQKVIQSTRNIKVPVGAGAYQATNKENSNNYDELISGFFTNNVVYFKRNEYFNTVGTMENAKIEKVRYQVVSSSNALNALETGEVHYISPQYTQYNMEELQRLAKSGIINMSTEQLGYGYIGINAKYVPDIELRKAIMAAMDTSLATDYYVQGTAQTIYWPMSLVSWAYPTANGQPDRDNMHSEYIAVNFSEAKAKEQIQKYMADAGVAAGNSKLKITFTIAGANIEDHPCYAIFIKAQKILNECGWDVQVVQDTQALTKLTTGSLAVWAAAWGSTIDPDMYQVYHKDSTATSVNAWGYPTIKNGSETQFGDEQDILDELSAVIEEARETNDQNERKILYKEAMGYVLDLAIELPVYQRNVLYAYNSKVIDKNSIPSASELNPYSSPLDHIWELDFAK